MKVGDRDLQFRGWWARAAKGTPWQLIWLNIAFALALMTAGWAVVFRGGPIWAWAIQAAIIGGYCFWTNLALRKWTGLGWTEGFRQLRRRNDDREREGGAAGEAQPPGVD